MTHPILEIQNLNHRFKKHQALKNISFSVKKGEIVGLIGRSGAGKSTLIRCLCALEKPTSGKALLDGIDLTQQPETRLIEIRRKIGLVFQHFNLLTSRTVAGNIALPLEISNMPKALRPARIKELLELVGLAGFEQKYPSQLSGGQKQRVGIARALAANPTLLLCDEATSALDPESTTSILNLLDDINRKLGLTIILITHEMDVVRRFAQRIIALDQGQLVEDGTLLNFLHDSGHKKTLQALLSDIRPQIPQEFKQALQADYSENALYIMRIVISQEIAYQPLFVTLYEKFAIKALLLQGGITTMRDTILGDMIIGIQGQNLEAAKKYLEQISQSTEEIGYVPHHH